MLVVCVVLFLVSETFVTMSCVNYSIGFINGTPPTSNVIANCMHYLSLIVDSFNQYLM